MPTPNSIVNAALTLTIQDATQTTGSGANIVSRAVPGLSFQSAGVGQSNFYQSVTSVPISIVPATIESVNVLAGVFYIRNLGPGLLQVNISFGSTATSFNLGVGAAFLKIDPTVSSTNLNYINTVSILAVSGTICTVEYLWAQ